MNTELVPLKPKQLAVSNLPKFTTELPFFYLTKQRELLTQPIDFKGQDLAGNPIRWKVTPSTLGAPGIDAHEVWVKLIKPAIDEAREQNGGELPSVIPLGSVRECLRVLGWTAGGFQARDFFKCIRQMVAALCDADFWLPTTETDEQGKPLLRRIKGSFSRMTLYAIGSAHVTEEELQSGEFSFDFDVEDTVYIQLHPLEVEIQRHQPQRPVDNEYLFSVSPAARRWYELVAPKIFGVTNNRGSEYCDVRYSWYIERHHTLTRQTERRRVAMQMDKLTRDHKAFGYVSKVEYIEVKEPGKDVDFIIRYYPGSGAKESTKRIRSRAGKKNWKQLELPLPTTEAKRTPAMKPALPYPVSLTPEQQSYLETLTGLGVTESEARTLVTTRLDACRLKVPSVPYLPETQGKKNRAGNVRAFIERDDWQLPPAYLEAKAKAQEAAQGQARRRAIEACSLCDANGFRFVTDEKHPHGAMKQCEHDAEIEARYPTYRSHKDRLS
jgi:hypothetical protein